jgi:hypothetical protein
MSAFYDLASLVVVPSGYKASKVYAQKPLTTDGQLAFTRSTTATRVNSAGLIEASAVNVPRLDYLNSTCPKLLLEPSRTNLILQSSAFDNATWDRNGGAITANAVNSPDGTANADTFTEETATSTHYQYNATAITATAAAYTGSIFAKAGTRSRLIMGLYDGTAANYQMVQFDLTAGTIVQEASAGIGKIENYGNGWYRCSVTRTLTAVGCYLSFGPHTNTNLASLSVFPAYLGAGGTINLYGAQLELGAYSTSLIPTTTASVTRGGDDCGTTSLQSASLIGATAGTFFVETIKTDAAIWFNQRIFLTNTTTRSLLIDTSGGQIRLRTWDAASAGATITTSGLANGLVKYLVKWDGTNVKVFANGVLQGSSAQPSYAYTTYTAYESTSYSNNTISQLLFFPTALSDADCIALTA